jgi:predicted transcriptional regulator
MTKLTNAQRILKALASGPKTQINLKRETKIKNTYQVVANLVEKDLVSKVDGLVSLSSASKALGAAPSESDVISMLRNEVGNIEDGVRSLLATRTYLLRRIEEERSSV